MATERYYGRDLQRYAGKPLDFFRDMGIDLLDWQAHVLSDLLAHGDDGRMLYEKAAISVHRQGGKTYLLACIGVYRFVVYPGDVLTAAQGVDGSKQTTRYAGEMFRKSPELKRAVKEQRSRFLLRGTIYEWEVTSSDSIQARGRTPRTFLGDEAGWWEPRNEMLDAVSPALSAQDQPLLVLASTRGRKDSPLDVLLAPVLQPTKSRKAKGETGDKVYRYYVSGELVNPRMPSDYVDRERRRMNPIIFDREYKNILRSSESALAEDREIKEAFVLGRVTRNDVQAPRYIGCDLAEKGVSSVAVASMSPDGVVIVDEIAHWTGSGTHKFDPRTVEAWIIQARRRWNIVDVRLEKFQALASAYALQEHGLNVNVVTPTLASNVSRDSNLHKLIQSNRLALPRNERLERELHGAILKETANGVTLDGAASDPHPDLIVSVGYAALAAVEGRGAAQPAEFSFPGMRQIMQTLGTEQSVSSAGLAFPDMDHAARVAKFERETGQDYNVAAWTDPQRTAESLYPPTVDEVKQREKHQREREREEAKYVKEVMAAWPDNEPYAMAQLPDGSRLLHRKECSSVRALLIMYGRGEISDFLTLNEKYTDGLPRHDCCSPVEEVLPT